MMSQELFVYLLQSLDRLAPAEKEVIALGLFHHMGWGEMEQFVGEPSVTLQQRMLDGFRKLFARLIDEGKRDPKEDE